MKTLHLGDYAGLAASGADTIIDVRAPAEFAEDHIPGAVNLPVLSDAERAEVGTIYKQVSSFNARKIGAALVARNASSHLTGPLAAKDGAWQPLVYCWRGGQRSGSFATILDQVGWRVQLLHGGYRSYRRLVVNALYEEPVQHRLMVIEGGTGTAKTQMLHHLVSAGEQVIDLEGLANHRGSLLGRRAGGQPAQKMFESRLMSALSQLDPAKITWVEAESSKVGARIIPASFWQTMRAADRIEIKAPVAARAQYLADAYQDLTDDADRLHHQIDQLGVFHAASTIARWHSLSSERAWVPLARELVTLHYDQRYAKSMARAAPPLHVITLMDLTDATLVQAAQELIAWAK